MDSEYLWAGQDVTLNYKQYNDSQKWEEVQSDGDWVKLKHPELGHFLHVSEDGEKLTIEEDSKGISHFI